MYNGLTDEEVIENRKKYGSNELEKSKKDGFFKLLISTLGDPIIKILLIALAIKTVFLFRNFDWYETIGIVIAILLASFISTISEYGSEKAFEKLQEEVSRIKCKVIRNGKKVEIPISEVVVGDIVSLETGDKIPADGIIIKGKISVDESSLNGETKESYKEASLFNKQSEKNTVFKGSVVYSNTALMKVTKVGTDTFYGKIALELQEKQPETPLKLRLRELAKFISKIGYIGAFLVFFSYLFKVVVINNNFNIEEIKLMVTNFPLITGHILYALTLCVTIIIVAVPEGLPMMITLVLSSNMKRMMKDNVLVRKLIGIETSGSINILFTDKTGTLTHGKLEVINIINGEFKEYKKEKDLIKDKKYYDLVKLCCIGNNQSSYGENNIIGGNITDRAILSYFKDDNYKVKRDKIIPFSSKNKYSITTVGNLNLIKGAPEVILKHCKTYYDSNGKERPIINMRKVENLISEYTKKGIRVLVSATSKNINPEKFENLTLLSIILIKDEVRKEAIEGVKMVMDAHVKTVMITGDNKDTALSIAKEVGLYKEGDLVLTHEELDKMSDEELKSKILNISIVARSLPSDKSRLVRLSQELNLVVGMTGDGVNDAPALKKADVGFSMGSGTEVAKEASDIVILDDNFLSISKAILFGRTIFKSIRKFIILQLTINLCALSLSIIGPFIDIEMPITVIQMLWINMVMDTLAGLAFSFEPPLPEYMKEYPKKKEENIMNKYMINQIFFTGVYSSLVCILFLKLPFVRNLFRYDINDKYLYTAFFGLFIFIDIFNEFNARTHRLNLLANILKNKVFIIVVTFIVIVQIFLIYYGGNLFRTSGLTLFEFEVMLAFAFTVIPFDWIRKLVLRSKGIKGGV